MGPMLHNEAPPVGCIATPPATLAEIGGKLRGCKSAQGCRMLPCCQPAETRRRKHVPYRQDIASTTSSRPHARVSPERISTRGGGQALNQTKFGLCDHR
jgi:hypothetical protein